MQEPTGDLDTSDAATGKVGDKVTWSADVSGSTIEGYTTVSEYEWLTEIQGTEPLDGDAYLCANVEVGITSPNSRVTISSSGFGLVDRSGNVYTDSYRMPEGKTRFPVETISSGSSESGWICFDANKSETALIMAMQQGGVMSAIQIPAN